MDKYIFDECNGLWYELQGDYYIPCLILAEEEIQPIGLWGQRHKQYLKKQIAAKKNVTEKLKTDDPMLWVQKMNEIQSRVRKIIYNEIIYA